MPVVGARPAVSPRSTWLATHKVRKLREPSSSCSKLGDGPRVEVDGLAFTLHEIGPGESHADSYWLLEGASQHVFVGDVVLHGHHAYVSGGHTTAWLANLAGLRAQIAPAATLHPGHGEPGGLALLDWQQEYLTTYRAESRPRLGRF